MHKLRAEFVSSLDTLGLVALLDTVKAGTVDVLDSETIVGDADKVMRVIGAVADGEHGLLVSVCCV